MFVINQETNTISSLNRKTFTELSYSERYHLQEWIAKNPSALGEELLIIQKEFNGFADTYERLDLLAIDKEGNLVIIENKLDDSGKDVTWQAIKYASYCNTLSKDQIANIYQKYLEVHGIPGKIAQSEIAEFFNGKDWAEINLNTANSQRIFLVAANFRKEVTSSVLWLANFNLQIKCFKTTPYEYNGQYFLTIDQIIPVKDIQEYTISMANKTQEILTTEVEVKNRHKKRMQFWTYLLQEIKGKSTLFQNSNPTKDHWLVAGGTNISGMSYQFIITMTEATVSLNFARASKEENKLLFDLLYGEKADVEKKFGYQLAWSRLDDNKSSKINYDLPGVNYYNKEDWPAIAKFLIEYMNKLEAATKEYLTKMKKSLNHPDVGAEII